MGGELLQGRFHLDGAHVDVLPRLGERAVPQDRLNGRRRSARLGEQARGSPAISPIRRPRKNIASIARASVGEARARAVERT